MALGTTWHKGGTKKRWFPSPPLVRVCSHHPAPSGSQVLRREGRGKQGTMVGAASSALLCWGCPQSMLSSGLPQVQQAALEVTQGSGGEDSSTSSE